MSCCFLKQIMILFQACSSYTNFLLILFPCIATINKRTQLILRRHFANMWTRVTKF